MRLESMKQLWFRKKSGIVREPLYTLPEIADKLGMEHKTIDAYMKGKKEGKPKPVIRPNGVTAGHRNNLYKLSEFKTWIKQLGETK